ncbi:TPA: hypothetical protein N0F65_011015, partial [Lagenidium giganteum]
MLLSLTSLVCLLPVSGGDDTISATDAIADTPTAPQPQSSVATELFRYVFIVVLVTMSAMFSGLTLGLMSLDKVGLEVIIGAGENETATDEERDKGDAARRILPVRESGNLLLTTLVLGNISVNSLLSILMADLTSGLVGFLVSTVVIVIFGEIVPQALCSRHALRIGSTLVPLVRGLIFIFYVIAKPVAIVLDRTIGEDIGMIFTRCELQKLLEIHVKQQALHPEEGHILRGAMGYKRKPSKLSMDMIKKIYKRGFSRIPVYDKDPNNIVGIIFAKDLVLINPKEEVPLQQFVQVFGRGAQRVWADSTLGEVLRVFKKGGVHMALVYDVNNSGPGDPFYELKGLVTFEDIVEEILQDKIVDDTDSPALRKVRSTCADRITMDYGECFVAVVAGGEPDTDFNAFSMTDSDEEC